MPILLIFLALIIPLQAQERPNLLWITSEDNSSHWIGCYGNRQFQTPHIDALAKDGLLFEHAYSNAPVCAVARALIADVNSEMDSFSLLDLLNTLRRFDLLDQLPENWAAEKNTKAGNQDYIQRFKQKIKD